MVHLFETSFLAKQLKKENILLIIIKIRNGSYLFLFDDRPI